MAGAGRGDRRSAKGSLFPGQASVSLIEEVINNPEWSGREPYSCPGRGKANSVASTFEGRFRNPEKRTGLCIWESETPTWTRTLARHFALNFRPLNSLPTNSCAFPWLLPCRHQGEGVQRPALTAEWQLHTRAPAVLFPWLRACRSQQLALLPQRRLQHHSEVRRSGHRCPPHASQTAPVWCFRYLRAA